jgi:hypothetical protein
MCFLLFLLDDRRIPIRIRVSDQWIRILQAQKHMDPTDPDSDSDSQHREVRTDKAIIVV